MGESAFQAAIRSRRWRVAGIGLAVAAVLATAGSALARPGSCRDPEFLDSYACRQVILRARSESDLARVMSAYGLRLIGTIPQLEQTWLEAPEGCNVPALLRQLRREPGIDQVDRNEDFSSPECRQLNGALLELDGAVASEVWNQPALVTMNAPANRSHAGHGVLVAVLDTGISRSHPDLAGSLTSRGFDFVSGSELADDLGDGVDDDEDGETDEGWGHGTAVAGLVRLVAPAVRLLPVRVLDSDCQGSAFTIASGIVAAVDAGARILNLSLGALDRSSVIQEALRYAAHARVLVVAAGGNWLGESVPELQVFFPARDPHCLAVTAVDEQLVAPEWVVAGGPIDLCAPGVAVAAPYRDSYALADGTSFAAALVSGAAAVAIAAADQPGLDPVDVEALLAASAVAVEPYNPASLAGQLGAGVPDLTVLGASRRIRLPAAPAPVGGGGSLGSVSPVSAPAGALATAGTSP